MEGMKREGEGRGVSYFMIKSQSLEALERAFVHNIWAVPLKENPKPHEELNSAFDMGEVILIASVGKTKRFQGYAKMMQRITTDQGNQLTVKRESPIQLTDAFKVHWIKKYSDLKSCPGLPFSRAQHLTNSETGLSVCMTRNCQKLSGDTGKVLCELIDEDLLEYETKLREKEFKKLQKMEERKKRSIKVDFFENWIEEEKTWPSEQHIITNFINKIKNLGDIILVSKFGSRRYNTHTETSDLDIFAVVSYKKEYVYNIDPLEGTFKNPEGSKTDFTIHSAEYFCSLLLDGDAKILETLYENENSIILKSESWDRFISIAQLDHRFITKQVILNYLGEIKGPKGLKQINKLSQKLGENINDNEWKTRFWKKWYILFRCLIHAKQALFEGWIKVWLPQDSEERQFLLDIRAQRISHPELMDRYNMEIMNIETFLKSKNFEDNPEELKKIANGWLYSLRGELKDTKVLAPRYPPQIQTILSNLNINIEGNILLFLSKRVSDNKEEFIGIFTNTAHSLSSTSPPTNKIISNIQNQPKKNPKQVEQSPSTYIFSELTRYCQQLEGGYPAMLFDTLWIPTDQILYQHDIWNTLQDNKQQLVTARLLCQCLGWITSQISQLKLSIFKNTPKADPQEKTKKLNVHIPANHKHLIDINRLREILFFLEECLKKMEEEAKTDLQHLKSLVRTVKIEEVNTNPAVINILEEIIAMEIFNPYIFDHLPISPTETNFNWLEELCIHIRMLTFN
eukprot:TRINITY_DN5670_c0_g1_i2.p1 TRINITY_DN5670_c0_g1~~TRINITY_DN5670_c0_g1_i2.p1  ORF type:complete len:741 (-),score=203.46 TRINITY_DN5670_c0_g1_i2:11-2233(-)